MSMIEPDVEAAPWEGQAAADDAPLSPADRLSVRALALLSRQARASRVRRRGAVGGLDDDRPAAAHRKGRTARRAQRRRADRRALHRDARRDRAHLFDQRHDRNAELHPAHRRRSRRLGAHLGAQLRAPRGVKRGERIVSTYNAGPFVAGAALDAFERLGLCHIPVGTGNTERLMMAVELLKPDRRRDDAVLRAASGRMGARRAASICQARSVERLMVAGEPGGGEPAMRARLEAGWGASVTEAMGIGDISVSLWGECEAKAGMHFSGRGFVHFELIDPDDAARAVALADGAEGELVLTHLVNRSAPLLRFRTRDHVRLGIGPLRLRPHRAARALHRAHRRHADRARRQRVPFRLREVVNEFAPAVDRRHHDPAARAGVRQEPPLPVRSRSPTGVERNASPNASAPRVRDTLLVTDRDRTRRRPAALPRSEYKSKLVENV